MLYQRRAHMGVRMMMLKKRSLFLVLILSFVYVTVTGQTPAFHDIRPGYGVTSMHWLSDYHPPLRHTPGDTRVYVLDSGYKGGTAVVMGGTHGNEIAGVIAATVLVENARVTTGRLIVIPHANNANVDYKATSRTDIPETFTLTASDGTERTFRYGSRRTNPAYEPDDPDVYVRPDGAEHEGMEIRNLNRVHPGVADGTLTEQIGYAISQLLIQEEAHIAFDLHEAGETSRLANTLVAHNDALDVGAAAIIDLSMEGIQINLEPSRKQFRGLSHREWGDHTPALAFLTETANPGQTPNADNPDVVHNEENPLYDRVGRQLSMVLHVIQAAVDAGIPDITIENAPTYHDMLSNGLEAWLNGNKAK